MNPPRIGSTTPWGIAQDIHVHSPDIVQVSTPSHGGLWVSLDLSRRMPQECSDFAEQWSGSNRWYEEDCAAVAVHYLALRDERYKEGFLHFFPDAAEELPPATQEPQA